MKSLPAKLIILLLIAAAVGAVWYFKFKPPPSAASQSAATPMTMERKILFYKSPMHPWIKSDKPGKCTICGMDLVPVYESSDGTNSALGLKLHADSVTVLDVQTVPVTTHPLVHTLRVAGTITASSWTAAWFEFIAYERDLAWLKPGQTIAITVPALPGENFSAKIILRSQRPVADTEIDSSSGSIKFRAELAGGAMETPGFGGKKLFTGLYAEGKVIVETPDVLAVPRSAVLSPGAQPMVYVDAANGTYEPRKIKLGRIGDNFAEVLDGVKEGEKVVTNGNLLIDAEAQISQLANQ